MNIALHFALVVLCGAILAIDKKAVAQTMLHQPIAASLLAALAGGGTALLTVGERVGIPLQILFLGGNNLGASLPPDETLAAVVAAGSLALVLGPIAEATPHANVFDLRMTALALLAAPLIALFGRFSTARREARNADLLHRADAAAKAGDLRALDRAHLFGIVRTFGESAMLVALSTGALTVTLVFVMRHARADQPQVFAAVAVMEILVGAAALLSGFARRRHFAVAILCAASAAAVLAIGGI